MKIRPVGAELFHADRRTKGRTDMTKLMSLSEILRTRLKRDSVKCILPELRQQELETRFVVPS